MIKCENVTIKYGPFTVLENVSFSVEKGDFLTILGENGCGKSSLVKGILGLSKISGGKIEKNFSGGVGYVPQLPPVQSDFPASAIEIVMSGFVKKAGLFYSREQKKEALLKMERLGISDIKNMCFREMSGGQRQRVLLSRALCAGEELLVLDEPIASLDEDITESFYEILCDLNKKGTTIIMISHDSKNALRFSNKVLVFKNRDYFFGDVETFIKGQGQND